MGLFGAPGRWEGLIACPLTPYGADGEVDAEVHERQVRFLVDAGFPALCSLMHVAESLNLSGRERRALTEGTVRAAAGVPVVAHVSCPGTDHTVAFARHAEQVGAAAVIATSPYHWHPGEDGLLAHFSAVGHAVEIPWLAYSPPPGAGTALSTGLVAQLIEHAPGFLGLKEAGNRIPDFAAFTATARALRPDFSVFGGIEYTLPQAVLGGAGSFSICALVAPRLTLALGRAVAARDLVAAAPLQERMNRLLELLVPRYPAGVKAAAGVLGRDLGPTRGPVLPLSSDELRALTAGLDACGVLGSEPYGWDPGAGPDPERARAVLRTAG